MYCSKACQRIDWKKQHKKICKFLNVGHGDRQIRTNDHTSRQSDLKGRFERDKHDLDEGGKSFFKLFTELTFEESQREAVPEMKKVAKRQHKNIQKWMLFHSLDVLIRSSNSEMLSWPNNPLLVMLQVVDPSVLYGDEEMRITPLHFLASLADPFDYSTHENQLILAKQLIDHGANVNTGSIPRGLTALHDACQSTNVTNLDFVKLLLERGADPNARDYMGKTPLFYSFANAPGAAKFLLTWPTTDANITMRSGTSFLVGVRRTLKLFSDKLARPDNPEQVQHQFLLQQWREIEEMLVEKEAADTGIVE
jgi:hypothetical protein